ncbi:MAG: 3-isopropylmalate dehydratase small subunit [Acidithiobacillales bacterium]
MNASILPKIERIEGTALPLRGDNMDTDRIFPARFLLSVTFEGIERHVFEDDRKARAGTASPHPFDDPRYAGASILVVNRNFGCGSSREHAPQALRRWGIRAIVGESFSEIFFGNALVLGLPCVVAGAEAIYELMAEATARPPLRLAVDLRAGTVAAGNRSFPVTLPGPAREALLSGRWDVTDLLLDRFEEVERVAGNLPYMSGF